METTVAIRKIRETELPELLALYRHLHVDDPPLEITKNIEQLWQKICSDSNLHYFVAEIDSRLVSTCTLTVVPNLTRGARPYGLIE
ncbi:MAG TPA: hypothetical protein VGJ15_03960, partial [Pirellulales bacterium]